MTRPMRVAFLSEHASPAARLGGEDAGGQNVYIDELTRHLARLGYEIDIFIRSGDPNEPETVAWAPGVRLINVHVGPPDVLQKDDLWPLMPAFRDAIMEFIRKSGSRYDLIHGNFWMSGWVAIELQRRLNIPAVQIFHALGVSKRRHQGTADTSPDERIAVEKNIVDSVDRIIAQCPSEVLQLVEDYSADPDKVAVIPSAVNTERFRPVPQEVARQRIGLNTEGFVIVYVGRIVRRKGVRTVVRAVAEMVQRDGVRESEVTLLIVGGESREPNPEVTPEIGALQRLAAELGITDRLHFAGCRPQEVLRDYYNAGDVVVSTPWYEPFGLTPLEAMACGRPVIGAAVGGITFTVEDEETGFLVPPEEPYALADRLQQFLEQPGLTEKMGKAARARVEREFVWPAVAARTSILYRTTLLTRNYDADAGRVLKAPATVPDKGGRRGVG